MIFGKKKTDSTKEMFTEQSQGIADLLEKQKEAVAKVLRAAERATNSHNGNGHSLNKKIGAH